MKRDGLRVAFEAWNFCNEVGLEAPHMGSPRAADCFDVSTSGYSLDHKVSDSDNNLGVGKSNQESYQKQHYTTLIFTPSKKSST